MSNKPRSLGVSDWIVFVGVIIILAVCLFVDRRDMGSKQIVVVVISSVASAVVTYLLLRGQKHDLEEQRERDRLFEMEQLEAEEKRSKGVQIYSNKIAAFSAFNEVVWQNKLDWSEEKAEVINNIRKELFSKVILYLSSSEITQITQIIEQIIKGQTNDFPFVLSSIVEVLNNNAEQTLFKKDNSDGPDENYRKACKALWNVLNDWMNSDDSNEATEDVIKDSSELEESRRNLKPGIQTWHFSMWDASQIKSLNNGGKELSLVEYGEYWRTNLVEQVKPGDIVFLFRGNKRYSGVFIAKGWRIFDYDEGRNVTERTSGGIPREVVLGDAVPIESVASKLGEYDFYGSYEDPNSTSCANVIVEPISYVPEGVPNPNTTYRKTISRYYSAYAVSLLEEFIKADPKSRAAIEDLFV